MVIEIEKRKWIKINLSVYCDASLIIKWKKEFKEYAEEVGWKIEIDKEGRVDEGGIRLYAVELIPNNDRLISPEELRKNMDKLHGFAQNVFRQIYPDAKVGNINDQPIKFLNAKNPEEVKFHYSFFEVLNLNYNLKDRIKLYRESPQLEKYIFRQSIIDLFNIYGINKTRFWNNLLESKEVIQYRKEFKKRLKEWYDIDIG